MTAHHPVRISFAFSRADDSALSDCVGVLRKAGIRLQPLKALRALIYMASESDLLAHSVRWTATLARNGGGETPGASRPTLVLEQAQLRKLDSVVLQLSHANIVATRTFVVRALLHGAPTGRALVQLYNDFEKEFPLKPRGLSKLRLEHKSRGAG